MSDEDQLEAALNLSRSEGPSDDHTSDTSVKKNCIPVGEPLFTDSLKISADSVKISTDSLGQPCNDDVLQTSPDVQQHSATPFGDAKESSWSKPLTPDRPSTLSTRALKRRISKELFPADCDLKSEEIPLPSLPDAFDTSLFIFIIVSQNKTSPDNFT